MNAFPLFDTHRRPHLFVTTTVRTVRHIPRWCLLAAIWSVFSLFSTMALAQHTRPLEIGVIGGDGVLWAYRRDASETNSADLLRFCYQMTDDSSTHRFWPGPVVVGEVAVATTQGTGLHTFFRDGTHRHYLPDPRIMRTGPPFSDLGEVALPLQTPPLAVCWDEGNFCLVAVISAAQAAALPPPHHEEAKTTTGQTTKENAEKATSTEDPPETPASMSVASPQPAIPTPFALARYSARQWILDRATPPDLGAEGVIVGVLARDGTTHLVYADGVGSHTLHHRVLPATGDTWSEKTTWKLSAHTEPVALGWQHDQPVVVFRETALNGVTIGTISMVEGKWKAGPLLAKNAAEAERFEDAPEASVAGASVVVAISDPQGDVRIGTWSVASGGVVQAPAIAPPLAPSLFPKADPAARHILQYAILLAALAAVFIWRRDNVMLLIPVGKHNHYARFQHRFLAFTMDLVILAPVWGFILYRLTDQSDQGITIAEQLMQNRNTLPAAWFWSWAIIGAVFAPYATIFEHWLGATPGKRIIGCRVVTERGRPCSFPSILIRNAVRPIEFHFTAIALLVFLTPSRQRLGDILSGTIVVETADREGVEGNEADDENSDHTDLIA